MRAQIAALLAGLALLVGCPAKGTPPAEAGPATDPTARPALAPFRLLFPDLDAPVLGIWGASASDILMVGGTAVKSRALLFRDGRYFQVETGARSALWWAFGFARDDIFAVGEEATILHFDGRRFSTLAMGGPDDATYWGIWGPSRDDLWVVGGSTQLGGPKAVVLRGDGRAFTPLQLPDAPAVNLYKVWGAAGEVFIVGEQGVIYRSVGGGPLTRMASNTTETLFTVTGLGPRDVYAVGGTANGVVIHYDGAAWTRIDGDALPRVLNGVAVSSGLDPLVVGQRGSAGRRHGGVFEALDTPTTRTLHVVWTDGRSVALAAGGNLGAVQGRGVRGSVLVAGPLPAREIEDWPDDPPRRAVDGGGGEGDAGREGVGDDGGR